MSAAEPRRPARAWIQYAAVVRKEVLQTLRDRRVMFMLIVAPLMQTVVFGFAVDFDVDRVPTVVVDQDRSDESRDPPAPRARRRDAARRRRRPRAPSEARAALDARRGRGGRWSSRRASAPTWPPGGPPRCR